MAKCIEQSLSRELFDLAKNYNDVIDLTLGDPDVAPSQKIKDAACASIQGSKIRYSANAGLPALRKEIANLIRKEYSINVDENKNVIATVGGMEALFLSLACLIDGGDEVIILGPYYSNYKQMVSMCGGQPVIVNTLAENGFMPKINQLEEAISDKTIAIIVNSPCNPTGVVYDKKTLETIANFAKKHDLMIITDEVYKALIFDGKKHESILDFDDMQERTILIDSVSKRYAMTGYRVGFAVAPEELVSNMVRMQEYVAACAPVSSQYAAIEAYSNCYEDSFIREKFEERRNYIYQAISQIDKLSCIKPQGAFYLFVNVEKTGLNGLEFAYKLLENEQVAVVPGISYGEAYSNYIRIAYTVEVDVLKKAVERINRFMEKL